MQPNKSDIESVRRKPGVLERYVELLYRRKTTALLAVFRLRRRLTAQEFRFFMEEERLSTIVRAVTFFVLGFVAAFVVFHILFSVKIVKADEPPPMSKSVFLIGDSQGWLLMHDLPRTIPPGYSIHGAPVPGSSIISWSRGDHAKEFSQARRAKPDILMVVLGTNDAYMGPRIIKNEYPYLLKLMENLEKITKNIVWVGPPWLERRVQGVEHFQMMLSGMDGVRMKYLNSFDILDLQFWDDKMHCARPGPLGCEHWAKWIWSKRLEFLISPMVASP